MKIQMIMKISFLVFVHSFILASQQADGERTQFVEMSESKAKFLDEQKKEKTERESYIQRSTCCNRSLAMYCGKGVIIAVLLGGVVYGLNEFGKAMSPSWPDSPNEPSTNATSVVQAHRMHLHSLLRPLAQSHAPYQTKAGMIHTSGARKNKSDKRQFFTPSSHKNFTRKKK